MTEQTKWDTMWKYAGNTDLMASEDGVRFFPVVFTLTCPSNCGKPGCVFLRGSDERSG